MVLFNRMQQKKQDMRQPHLQVIVQNCQNKSLHFVDVNGPRKQIASLAVFSSADIMFNFSEKNATLRACQNKEFRISHFMNPQLVFMVGMVWKTSQVKENQSDKPRQIKTVNIYPPYNMVSRIARDLSRRNIMQGLFLKINKKMESNGQNIEGHTISKGEIIKFGKEAYFISHIQHPGDVSNKIQKMLRQYESEEVYTQRQNFQGICRICYCQQGKGRRKILISPCQCKGSCQFIHFSCLSKWIQTKNLCQSSKNAKSFNLSKIKCQICRNELPKIYVLMGKSYFLFSDFQQDLDNSYIILRKLSEVNGRSMKSNDNNMLHIIKVSQNETVTIGRKSDNDVVLSDLTVSRYHAEIRLGKYSFELFDLNSRYGTLVSFQDKVEVGEKVEIQLGSNIFLLRKE